MEHAVEQIVPEGGERPMDMALLAATVAISAGQVGPAVQAVAFARLRPAGSGFDRPREQAARDRVARALDPRDHITIMAQPWPGVEDASYRPAMTRAGLLGDSFNPAHGGHPHTSFAAMDALAVD